MRIIFFLLFGASLVLCGCDKSKPVATGNEFELVVVTNSTAKIYEINKVTGAAFVISGSEYTLVKPSDDVLAGTNSYLIDWGNVAVSSGTNSVNFKLKTKWKNGLMHYLLTVSPNDGFLQAQLEPTQEQPPSPPPSSTDTAEFLNGIARATNSAQLSDFLQKSPFEAHTNTYDSSWLYTANYNEPEFELFFYDNDGFKVQMFYIPLSLMTAAIDDKNALSIDDSIECSREDYESFKNWGAGWRNFRAVQ